MAVAANAIEVRLDTKVPIGYGRAMYFGSVTAAGTAYATGGAALEDNGGRYGVPTRIDSIEIGGLLPVSLVAPNKVKVLSNATVTAKKTGFVEYENGETLATAFAAGTTVKIIGAA